MNQRVIKDFHMPLLIIALFIVVLITAFIGWVLNIVQVIHVIAEPVTGLFVIKCIGVLMAPLGAVLGWIGVL